MLIGHQRIWDFLVRSVRQDRLAHAYLFAGPGQVGKMTLAREWAKWQLCEQPKGDVACGRCRQCLAIERGQNPDLIILAPCTEEKDGVSKTSEISIKETRELQRQLSLFPYSAKRKIAIIEEVAAMSGEAANAILKTLEEPSGHSLIILVSANWQVILPTIISRCQLIKFSLVPEAEIVAGLKKIAVRENIISEAVNLAAGKPGQAIRLAQEPELLAEQKKSTGEFIKLLQSPLSIRWETARVLAQDPGKAQEALGSWLLWLRDRVLEQSGRGDLIINKSSGEEPLNKYAVGTLLVVCREIQKTKNILNNSSFNARLAIEVLMTKI